jgi:hypothetical protein
MPLAKKLIQLKKGQKVKPPKAWFNKMYSRIRKEYPKYSSKRSMKIVAGIWYRYPLPIQLRIIRSLAKEGAKRL